MIDKNLSNLMRIASGLKRDADQQTLDGIASYFRDSAVMSDWNLLPPIIENIHPSCILSQDIRESYYKLLGFQMMQRKWLNEFEKILLAKDLKIIIMKGHGLWGNVYSANYPRISADIDILVCPEDFKQVSEILSKQGTFHGETNLHSRFDLNFPYNFRVELHWNLFDFNSFNFNFDQIWEDSSFHPLFKSQRILTMGLEDLFIHTLVHGFNHRHFQIYMLVDLVRILTNPDIQYDLIKKKAINAGCLRIFSLTMARIEYLVNFTVDKEKMNLPEANIFYRWLYSHIFTKHRKQSPFELQRLIQFFLLDKLKNRAMNFYGSYSCFLSHGIKKITHPKDRSTNSHT